MSRIGRKPITIPAGVTVTVDQKHVCTVKGPKGTLTEQLPAIIDVNIEGAELVCTRPNDDNETRALHGLSRALINNMVVGVTEGFSKKLEINGVGYKASLNGKQLVLNLGYSHPVTFDAPEGITFEVPTANSVVVSGISKQTVGQLAAEIRGVRPPEPYLGKGVKYTGEIIRRKAGKAGKK